MSKILEQINETNDIKKINPKDYSKLAGEIRRFLIEHVSKTGGHLSSNLGVVELTMALHLFLDFPKDKLVWDVGHQSYTHKILTGRKEGFRTLRQFGGMSGFPKRKESNADAFNTGHSSTSISAALGMAKARDIKGDNNKIVAVIGDGALSGGMAFEALNNAGRMKTNMIIVLNDNNMSISENVGGMANYLGKIRTNDRYQGLKNDVESTLLKLPMIGNKIADKLKRSKDSIKRLVVPGMLFEDMGLTYIGPLNGHNLPLMVSALETASKQKGAVLVHVVTKKGKGFSMAEKNPSAFHGVNPFELKTGKAKEVKTGSSYTDVFSSALCKMAKKQKEIVAVTAAMPSGTGLMPFKEAFPERFYDVGIAEEHAVTFAAGLAAEGLRPVVAIYSTFLQRAYDQILHDVCISKLPVIFAIDRAGLVGNDGETHQGVFDLSFLMNIPNLTIMAPKNAKELQEMFRFAFTVNGPVAIRYPRGTAYEGLQDKSEPIVLGRSEWITKEDGIALFAYGNMVKTAEAVRRKLKEEGKNVSLINMRFAAPMDTECIDEIAKNHNIIVTLEENVENGGIGQVVSAYICEKGLPLKQINVSIPNKFIEHGDVKRLYRHIGLDEDSIVERIRNLE